MDPLSCEQLCRICASLGTDYTSIFDGNSDGIGEKINQCLPITVSEYDRLPLHICSECLNDLLVSYELREKSLESEKQSREQFNSNGINIKSEKDHNADDNNPIFCAICEINFDNTVQFNGHMKELHLSEWKCNLCGENFKTSDDLFQHKYTNHYDKTEKYDETDENIENFSSVDNTSSVDVKSIDIKEEPLPSTTDNSLKKKSTLKIKPTLQIQQKTVIVCDICGVNVNNENEMVHHRKFHAPLAMTCSLCLVECPSPYEFFLHKQDVHKNYRGQKKKYYCENCEGFTSCFTAFRKHFNCKNEKCKSENFKCQFCNRGFTKRLELIIHQTNQHQEHMLVDLNCEKWNCSTCGKIFICELEYRQHIFGHTEKKIEKTFKCSHCDMSFTEPAHLRIHIDNCRAKVPKFQCDMCSKWFFTTAGLLGHQKRHRDQTCQECNKQFPDFHTFSTHMKKVHSVTSIGEEYACNQCPRKFTRMRQLRDHENIHTGKEPYSCEVCQQRFRTYAAKWSHGQRHRNEAYTCDYCKREFKTKTHMARHILGHLPRESWRHECEVCKFKCKTRWHLIKHMRIHLATLDHHYGKEIIF